MKHTILELIQVLLAAVTKDLEMSTLKIILATVSQEVSQET